MLRTRFRDDKNSKRIPVSLGLLLGYSQNSNEEIHHLQKETLYIYFTHTGLSYIYIYVIAIVYSHNLSKHFSNPMPQILYFSLKCDTKSFHLPSDPQHFPCAPEARCWRCWSPPIYRPVRRWKPRSLGRFNNIRVF